MDLQPEMQSGTMKTMTAEMNAENDIKKTRKEKKLGGIKTLPFILGTYIYIYIL